MATKFRDVTERLFREITGRELDAWVLDRRQEGDSWRQIERRLRDEYDIEVSNVTLIAWFGDGDRTVA